MKKCCCLIIICQLLIWVLAVAQAWGEDKVGANKASLRSAALKSNANATVKKTNPSASPASTRTSTSSSGVAIANEITRQRMELSSKWYLEGDYNYYDGWGGRYQWVSLDKPEIYAVYHVYPFEILTPYFRFGAEWLRQQDVYFYSSSRRQNDTVNLHMGGGLRFGFAEHMAVDLDMKYGVPLAGTKANSDSWGGTVGVLFYF